MKIWRMFHVMILNFVYEKWLEIQEIIFLGPNKIDNNSSLALFFSKTMTS